MKDPLLEIPRELDADFFVWKGDEENIGFPTDAAGIRAFTGQTLLISASGGRYDEKGLALASRQDLKGLCIDGRNIPQPLIDAAGEIQSLERIHLGFIGQRSLLPLAKLTSVNSLYLEGAKGTQEFSIHSMTELRSVSISGDTDAVRSLLRDGNPNVRYLTLGGTVSANLKLPDLELLQRFPGIEYLVLLDVSVKSRSLEPCLALRQLRGVIVNFSRNWWRESIAALKESGVWVRCRMDEIRPQMG